MNNQAKLVLGSALILIEMSTPGAGFTSVSGAEGVGFNLWAVILYSVSAYWIITGYKGIRNNK